MKLLITLLPIIAWILGIYLINFLLGRKIKGRFEPDGIPISYHIIKAISFISFTYLFTQGVQSFRDVNHLISNVSSKESLLLTGGIYLSFFLFITLILYFICTWLSSLFFSLILKDRKPIDDAVQGNASNAILYCGLLISVSLLLGNYLPDILNSFIPYPESSGFR